MQLDLLNVCVGPGGRRQGEPRISPDLSGLRRLQLDTEAWVDVLPHWLSGHSGLYEHLSRTTRWRDEVREMYERTVAVPRRVAFLPEDGPGHPVLNDVRFALQQHYSQELHRRVRFGPIGLGLYRTGRDSVAFHRDRGLRDRSQSIIAIVSLGAPRTFLLRPFGGGRSVRLTAGWGDLLVMGGTCQRDWEHAVPKCSHADPRMSVQFRWSAET